MSTPTAEQFRAARDALRAGLAAGVELEAISRHRVHLPAGQLLVMPAANDEFAGVKLVSVVPDNPHRGVPQVQGIYLLMDAETLTPVWQADGATLTDLRTAAVSLLAIELLLAARSPWPDASPGSEVRCAAVLGLGPAGRTHAAGLVALHDPSEVVMVGRDPLRTRAAADAVAEATGAAIGTATIDDLGRCDVVVCATSATSPLFERRAIDDRAVVAAVGTHVAAHTELPAALLADGSVYLESHAALAEAGDVLLAKTEYPDIGVRATLGELVRGDATPAATGPWVFKSVGAGWEDLCVAAAMFRDTRAR